MPPTSPQDESSIRAPHPLARCLIERLAGHGRVLDFASGSGRNGSALARAGFDVTALDDVAAGSDDPLAGIGDGSFRAVLSTHGFLHGTSAQVVRRLNTVASALEPGGLLYATFGSSSDARRRRGARVDAHAYAPIEGDERGVPHAFFDRQRLCDVLAPHFTLEMLEERTVDRIAGAWAHAELALAGAVHWFVVARRTSRS